jgi:RND family efflux transporter MFP subunit
MKQIFIYSILALFITSCGQGSPEANKKKVESLKTKIAKMEEQIQAIQDPADTIQVEKVFPVKTKTLTLQTIDKTIEYSANLIPFEELYMAPAQPGRISKIDVEIGDKVKKGQILIQMDQTQLKQAKIQLESLTKDYNRIKTLNETGSITEQQYDQIKSQLEITQSNVDFLNENTVLLAPFDGIVTGKYFENSENYSGAPNTQAGKAAIITLQQINIIKATINISEKYYSSLNKGIPVSLSCDTYPLEIFEGEIMNIHPTIDPTSRSFKVEIKVPNSDLKLRPGMFARVNITLGQTETLIVPAIAILQQEGTNKRYVFINKNNIAKRVNVKIGERFDDSMEIISDDIKIGDQLIVAGQAVLMNNNKVKVVK